MSRVPMRFAAVAAFSALPFLAAADTTAGQAASLGQQLRAWTARWVEPNVSVPDKLIEVAPEGDHYRVSINLSALPRLSVSEGGAVSAAVHAAAGGRWTIDDPRFASPTKMAIGARRHADPAEGTAGTDGAHATEVTATFGKAEGSGAIDPSLGQPSRVQIQLDGYDVARAGKTQDHTRIDSVSMQASLSPAGNGRLDFTDTSGAENYSSTRNAGAQAPVEFAAQHMRSKLAIAALDPDRVLPFVHALERLSHTRLSAMSMEYGGSSGSSAEGHPHAGERERQAAREAYLAFRGLASGGEVNDTIEGLRIAAAGHLLGLDKLGIGGRIGTPAGTLAANLSLDADGISSPEIPEDTREYAPHHIAIKPFVSGVNLAALDALIMAATAPEPNDAEVKTRIDALYAHGITTGIDTLTFDVGPARFSGSGKFVAHAADRITGEAELKASGFDTLIEKVQGTPGLAAGLPVLATMRSVARQDGEDLVWSLRMEKGVITINGRDLADLTGEEKPPH